MATTDEVMLLTSISKKLARKVKLNRNRRLRRKRSKKFFLLKLKAARAKRSTSSLCDIVDVFALEDEDLSMDFQLTQRHNRSTQSQNTNTTNSYTNTLEEVSEWQHQHQLAYWKSRAMALQMENQVLHRHIKDLYSHQMQNYLACKEHYNWDAVGPHKIDMNCESTEEAVEEEIDETKLPPTEAPGEAHRNKLTELYGDKAAKINGMETAIQLNYEYALNKDKPAYWPNLPLKL